MHQLFVSKRISLEKRFHIESYTMNAGCKIF